MIPFQIEYIFPKGIVRPRFAYGMNLFLPNYYPLSTLNFGGNIKLNSKLFLSAVADLHFKQAEVFFVPKNLFGSSFHLGLFMSLSSN